MPQTHKDKLRLWLRLLSCTNFIEYELQQRLRDRFGLSLARFDFLAQLYRAGKSELTMTELSQSLMVSGGNITGLTDRLSKEGLVERRADPADRRVQRIGLTNAGRDFFENMAEVHAEWVAEIFDSIDAGRSDELMNDLSLVKRSAERATSKRRLAEEKAS